MIRLAMKRGTIMAILVLSLITTIGVIIRNRVVKDSTGAEQIRDVPDEKTAIEIAKSIWVPTYGKVVLDEKRFHARLKNDSIWVVEAALKEGTDSVTAYAEIKRKDGKILKIVHH